MAENDAPEGRTLKQIVDELAFAVYYNHDSDLVRVEDIKRLLIEFAEEIQRRSTEP